MTSKEFSYAEMSNLKTNTDSESVSGGAASDARYLNPGLNSLLIQYANMYLAPITTKIKYARAHVYYKQDVERITLQNFSKVLRLKMSVG